MHGLQLFPLYSPAAVSSMQKGESLTDTVATMAALGATVVVVRHGENDACHKLQKSLGDKISIVNAGSGMLHHPTQALLDLFTIQEKLGRLSGLKVAIVGDLKHSRVAHSLINALNIMGDNEINLVAPEQLQIANPTVGLAFDNLAAGLKDVDVIYMLRIQKERFDASSTLQNYTKQWQLNNSTLGYAPDTAIIMHPGPFNRGVEISDKIVQHPRSCIEHQVTNGVFCRMSILDYVLT